MSAVVNDWPGGSAPLQPCQHVPGGLPYPLVMRVSCGVECGSHAAAPAVLTIRRGLQRTLVPVRDPDVGDGYTQADRLPHSRGGLRTRPYGRYLCHSPAHPRDAVNEGHHPITPVVITDPANGVTRSATFGVRQPCCRASRPHDPVRIAADSRAGTRP